MTTDYHGFHDILERVSDDRRGATMPDSRSDLPRLRLYLYQSLSISYDCCDTSCTNHLYFVSLGFTTDTNAPRTTDATAETHLSQIGHKNTTGDDCF